MKKELLSRKKKRRRENLRINKKKIKDKRKILEHFQEPCNCDEERSILNFQFYLLSFNMCSQSI